MFGSFLLLIGVTLIVGGWAAGVPHEPGERIIHGDKGYIYFAMVFSLFVELLNIRLRPSRPGRGHVGPRLASGGR